MKANNKTAISLIVLVITILVLSILAVVVIISLSNTNIIGQTSSTVFKQDMASYKEVYEMYLTNKLTEYATFDRSTLNITYESEEYEKILGNVSDKYKEGLKVIDGRLVYETEDETEKAILKELNMKVLKLISKDTSDGASPYIGHFADVDGDGIVDGVIFADLAYSKSGQWFNSDGAFSYDAVATNKLKDYEVIDESYTVMNSEGETLAGYGTKPVLSAIGNGKDRFYVMALSDVTQGADSTKRANWFKWYADASGISTSTTVTSGDFDTGKANTVTMIEKWNAEAYGTKNVDTSYLDMWGVIKQKVYGLESANDSIEGKTVSDVKWFVPSKAEWGAFGNAFSLTDSNYESYGLSRSYWSSSFWTMAGAGVVSGALYADFSYNGIYGSYFHSSWPVRLAATF